jgi:hypothetical protein
MRKWLFSSLVIAALAGCQQKSAEETADSSIDSGALRVDSLATQPDRTNVEPDSLPMPQDSVATNRSTGGAKKPGQSGPMPKPGTTTNKVDSIKASYPPKK